MSRFSRLTAVITALAGGLILALCASRSQAQSLFLVPSTTTASIGSSIVFTLNLTPAAGGSNGLESYDTNVFIDSSYLTFVGATPYTETTDGLMAFPDGDFFSTNNTQHVVNDGKIPNSNYPAGTNKVLRLSFTNYIDATLSSTTPLGTFTVQVTKTLPAAGTVVTLGPASAVANYGGSDLVGSIDPAAELLTSDGTPVTLSPAPEPSPCIVVLTGAALLALLARRRTARGLSA